MSSTPDNQNSLVPELKALPQEHTTCWFNDPEVEELCKKVKQAGNITDDELLVLGIAAGQAALTRYITPNHTEEAEKTINTLLSILDYTRLVTATRRKTRELLGFREGDATLTPSREHPPLTVDPHLSEVLEALYRSEINAAVSMESFWDDGWKWRIKLGDDWAGYEAEKLFDTAELRSKAAPWLIETAVKAFPDSVFAKERARALMAKQPRQIAHAS